MDNYQSEAIDFLELENPIQEKLISEEEGTRTHVHAGGARCLRRGCMCPGFQPYFPTPAYYYCGNCGHDERDHA